MGVLAHIGRGGTRHQDLDIEKTNDQAWPPFFAILFVDIKFKRS